MEFELLREAEKSISAEIWGGKAGAESRKDLDKILYDLKENEVSRKILFFSP